MRGPIKDGNLGGFIAAGALFSEAVAAETSLVRLHKFNAESQPWIMQHLITPAELGFQFRL